MSDVELCTRCERRPAHPEAFGLCGPCDDALYDFMGIESDGAAKAVSQSSKRLSSKRLSSTRRKQA